VRPSHAYWAYSRGVRDWFYLFLMYNKGQMCIKSEKKSIATSPPNATSETGSSSTTIATSLCIQSKQGCVGDALQHLFRLRRFTSRFEKVVVDIYESGQRIPTVRLLLLALVAAARFSDAHTLSTPRTLASHLSKFTLAGCCNIGAVSLDQGCAGRPGRLLLASGRFP
jgi:hypothetical protein